MTERCAGGIVLGDSGTLAMVWSKNSQAWLFPKGRTEEGETDEETARREITEETGLETLEYLDDLGTFVRPGTGGAATKEVHMYLFAAEPHAELTAHYGEEIERTCWMSFGRVAQELGAGENEKWFVADRAWFASVFDRVREAIQRD